MDTGRYRYSSLTPLPSLPLTHPCPYRLLPFIGLLFKIYLLTALNDLINH
uniref:Uncharacterized protein n=1 Tax=Picea glauca TaxID=3330 RepID=A0A124GP98_PICGL|nr:hypothetical protein ABT39_MTgene1155 [Picea glauca]